MGWTPSTRPRGNFARTSDVAKPRLEVAMPSSRLAATALIQSILLVALAIVFIAGNQMTGGQLADALALIALVTAGVGAYLVVNGDRDAGHQAPIDEALPGPPPRAATSISREQLISDAEQLAQLKARVSHELRTPLNAVIGFSELMQHEALGPVGNDRYREYAGHIRRSAEHFQWATERTLAVTEILASPRRRSRAQLRLASLAEAAFERAAREAAGDDGAGITRLVSIDEQILIEGCSEALDHSLQYLMSAALAVAWSDHGTGLIDISAECHECGQVALRFTVPLEGQAGGGLDGEQAPGAELSLLLARLGFELAGARLDVACAGRECWQATAWLSLAQQREFPLL